MSPRLVALAVVISCTPGALFGQTATSSSRNRETRTPYIQSSWTTETGLPENSVTALVQTRDGYLWLGTFGGLARFDGVKFTVFDTGNSPGLGGNRITYLYEDPDGGLWIAFESGGLSRYFAGSFVTYTTSEGLPDSRVVRLTHDRQGIIWATTALGTARLDNGRFVTEQMLFGLPNANLIYYLESGDGSAWLGPMHGLVRAAQGRLEAVLPRPSFIHEANDGSVWAYNRERGLDRYRDGAWTNYRVSADVVPGHDAARTTAFAGRDGTICVLTSAGVARFKDGSRVAFTPVSNLPEWRVAMEDREGNLWIGSNGLGLHRFKQARVTAYGKEEGLSDHMFMSIVDDTRGGLWLGGSTLFPWARSRLFHYRDDVFTEYSFEAVIWALRPDHQGGVWLGEYGKLRRLHDGRLTEYPQFEGTPVVAVFEDRDRVMWVGTLSGHVSGSPGGLYRYSGGTFTAIRKEEGLVHNNVRVITQDRAGALWVGTEGGLSRIRDGTFTNYTTKDGLSNDFVLDIHEDPDGTLWIATYGGGLSRFREGRFARVTTEHGLFENFIARILADDRGNFWMSSNHGIYRVARADLHAVADGRLRSVPYVPYGVADGMRTNECSAGGQPGGWKASDGKLWFPTLRGVVIVDPAEVDIAAPPVAIEQVLVDNQQVALAGTPDAPPGNGDFEFHYTGLSLASPEKVRFRYRLDGYDHDWMDAGTRRAAYYTNIPPGSYRFRVIASNGDGLWSQTGAAFAFRLRPHFYQTTGFRTVVTGGLFGLMWLGYHRRVTKLRTRHLKQQAFSRQLIQSQEGERRRIAAELHDSLGQNLLIIKNRALLGAMAATDHARAREEFAEIDTSVTQSIEEVRQIAYNLRPYHLDRLGLTQALEDMIERVADASGITFSTQIDGVDGLLLEDAEIGLFRIVQESLNNIVKHSAASRAGVEVVREGPRLRIRIWDNGKGFTPRAGDTAGGFGLAGMAERVRMLGGVRTIESLPGRGTRVSIELELPVKVEEAHESV